jgi:uncharacterized protein (DUF58 family)
MRPTQRAVLVFTAGVIAALAPVLLHPRLWTVWLAYLFATFVLLCADAIVGLSRRRLKVEPHVPDQIYIGSTGELRVTLTARGVQRPFEIDVLPEMDDGVEPVGVTTARLVPGEGGASTVLVLPIKPRRRGKPRIAALHLRWRGPLGLIERRNVTPVDRAVAVVPDVGAVRAIAIKMFSDREMLAGMKVERFLGDGSEFESLREYVPGLDHRAIDWKASARHVKLLCQEFRAERNHQVVLAIDAGQLMSEPLDGVPRLDHAINAALLLGWFGLRTGDRVGVVGFDERIRTFAEPAGGLHNFARLQRLTADIAYRHVETNYTLSLSEMTTRLRRRSLIVLLTDFLDTVTAEMMVENVQRLARRHLVLFVALRDPGVERRALALPRTIPTLHQAVVADDFARERSVVIERLRRAGVHTIDATPQKFSAQLLNRYLDIKRRELI